MRRRSPCREKHGINKGEWTAEEDQVLINYINKNGHGYWSSLPKFAGILRSGKSCRLRWANYLRPGIKRGPFNPEEENTLIQLHSMLGNKWAAIASHLPGRTDSEIKNLWNTRLKKRKMPSLDRNIYQPSFFSESTDVKLEEAESTRNTERVRLEGEAWLSKDLLLMDADSSVKTESDHFLRLWNSQVG